MKMVRLLKKKRESINETKKIEDEIEDFRKFLIELGVPRSIIRGKGDKSEFKHFVYDFMVCNWNGLY